MYHQFFGLQKEPFSMTPDPALLYLTVAHREALAGLSYSILSRKGVVLLTGDAGTGKPTLLSRIFQSIPSTRALFSVVLNPTLTPSEFLELALLDFGIEDIPASKAQRLVLLERFLTEAYRKQQVPVLVVDEAHKLSPEVMEEIRLLSNFELAESKLLQIVLAGQTELGALLNRVDLRQLKQRIAVRLAIHPLSLSDVHHYIQHRWQKAGATQPHPFHPDAVNRIAQVSRGIPRLVNAICDNALTLAYGEGNKDIGTAEIAEVASDLDLLDSHSRAPQAGQSPGADPMRVDRSAKAPDAANGLPTASGYRTAHGTEPLSLPLSGPGTVPTLERYETNATKPSLLARLANKLRGSRSTQYI